MTRLLIFIFIFGLFSSKLDLFGQNVNNSNSEHLVVAKKVNVSILLLDILKIDDVNKKMTLDFAIRMSWKDTTFTATDQTYILAEHPDLWYPEIQILNGVDLDKRIQEALNVKKDGSVFFVQRYAGEISLSTNFSKFPFDQHDFGIKCIGINTDSVVFEIDPNIESKANDNLTLAEWDVSDFHLELVPFDTQVRMLPGFEYKMHFKRKVQFYIWKTVIPLTLVILMSWTVFWVHPKHLEAQVAITVTSMLTMVTFQFILSNILPPLSYLTKMDIFIFGANFIVFMALIETIVSGYFYDKNKQDFAEKVDRIARYVFPVLLICTFIAAFLW